MEETEQAGHSAGDKNPEHRGSTFPQGIVDELDGAVTDRFFSNNLKRISVYILMGHG
jgi:hypothetical protein